MTLRTIIRIAIFWAAFCFLVLIGETILRGISWAIRFSWPHIGLALVLALLTELVILPRLPMPESKP